MTTLAPPRGWGEDALTAYLEAYRGNQFATFANKGQPVADLVRIDALFHRFLDGAINPRPLYPMGFMLRAHSAYRSGIGCVMGGQLYESQAMFRLCLEHAAYGFYIGADKDRLERWLRRGDSVEHRKVVRKEFHNDKLRAYIEAQSTTLCHQYDHLYARLIEFGAHPNEQGYSLSSAISRSNGDVRFETLYLHCDGAALDMGIRTAAQIGLWPLHLMQVIYCERYELLGIRSELDALRARY